MGLLKPAAWTLLIGLGVFAILARGAISQQPQNSVAISALNSGLFFPVIPGVANPNVTQANIGQTICKAGWTATIRPPTSMTNAIKQKLMGQLSIPWSARQQFELDHHDPLEAGGDPSSADNLALQSYVSKPWNAHKKDRLENLIHHQICEGTLTLQAGRAVFINTDWRAEYCRRFSDSACGTLAH